MNLSNYKFYINKSLDRPFDNDGSPYVVVRNNRSKKWGYFFLNTGKFKPANLPANYENYNQFVKNGNWIEVKVSEVVTYTITK